MNNLTFINDELSMLLYYNYSNIDYNPNSLKYAESILKRSLFYKAFIKNIEDLEKVVKSITELELFSLLQSLRSTPEMISNKTELLMSFAGKSSQIDFALGRLLGSAVNSNILSEKNLRNYLRNNWLKTNDERLLESFLKISMLSEIDFLSKEDVEKINGKKSETDLLLAFSDYCSIFEKREFVTTIHSLFNELIDYNPALSFFFEDNLKEIDNKRNGSHLSYEWNNLTNLFKDFVEVADSTLLQFMYYGDPAMTGKKNTGGLTTFLIALGNELSKKMNVITIGVLPVGKTNTGKIYKAISKHHTLLRIPLYITHSDQNEFIDKFTHIKRMIKRLLEILPGKKLKAHLRYSDHASLAAAETLKALSNKVFFTITADPHIKMVNSEGKIVNSDNETASIMLSKLYASEEVVKIADRLVGIGTGNSNEEIYKYFPDIFYNIEKQKFPKIPEGVEFKKSCHKFEVMPKAYYILLNKGLEYHLSEENLKEKPLIINVGRFDPLKGQHILAKTWSSSRLSDEYNLVLIGGNIKSPDRNEKIVLEEIKKNLKALREKEAAVLTGALENGIIRCLENSIIMNLVHETPHMYICSSYKEEFGISILEAMSAGFLIFAPRRGGVKGYIKSGENGFLINTDSADSIKEEVLIVLDSFKPKRLREIAEKGRQTVFDNFSIESIAKKYKKLYET